MKANTQLGYGDQATWGALKTPYELNEEYQEATNYCEECDEEIPAEDDLCEECAAIWHKEKLEKAQ